MCPVQANVSSATPAIHFLSWCLQRNMLLMWTKLPTIWLTCSKMDRSAWLGSPFNAIDRDSSFKCKWRMFSPLPRFLQLCSLLQMLALWHAFSLALCHLQQIFLWDILYNEMWTTKLYAMHAWMQVSALSLYSSSPATQIWNMPVLVTMLLLGLSNSPALTELVQVVLHFAIHFTSATWWC